MNIAIIGAGMAGLTAARHLAAHAQITLFDKARGVGGRMSTRYAGEYEFDHGAQYFTLTDPDFRSLIEGLRTQDQAAPWDSRGLYLQGETIAKDTGKPRWVGAPRMNSVPKAMAKGLTIHLGVRVVHIEEEAGSLQLLFEDGARKGPFDAVICTAPAPQAAALLPNRSPLQDPLSKVQMHACFALMVGLKEAFIADWDSLRAHDLPVSWIAHNSTKAGRPKTGSALVIHSAPDWSDAHKEADREWVHAQLLDCASTLCGHDLSKADHFALHRWLYAYSDQGVGSDYLIDESAGIILAGDWCVGGRVEGAYLSGRAAAKALLKWG